MAATAVSARPLVTTSIGKKVLVAASGVLFLAWVLAHMVGNLKFFLGPEAINSYGEWLRDMGEPAFPRGFLLWSMRVVLFVGLVLHVGLTIQLAQRSRSGRRHRYARTAIVDASYASRTMRWGGLAIFAFVIFHLAHFTWGSFQPDYLRGDVYANSVRSFEHWWLVALYGFALFAVAMHVYHGTWSTTQTLGLNRKGSDRGIRGAALSLAAVIFVGFMSVPVAVLAGARPYA